MTILSAVILAVGLFLNGYMLGRLVELKRGSKNIDLLMKDVFTLLDIEDNIIDKLCTMEVAPEEKLKIKNTIAQARAGHTKLKKELNI